LAFDFVLLVDFSYIANSNNKSKIKSTPP